MSESSSNSLKYNRKKDYIKKNTIHDSDGKYNHLFETYEKKMKLKKKNIRKEINILVDKKLAKSHNILYE